MIRFRWSEIHVIDSVRKLLTPTLRTRPSFRTFPAATMFEFAYQYAYINTVTAKPYKTVIYCCQCLLILRHQSSIQLNIEKENFHEFITQLTKRTSNGTFISLKLMSGRLAIATTLIDMWNQFLCTFFFSLVLIVLSFNTDDAL